MFQAFRRTPAGRAAPGRPRPLPALEPLEDRRVPAVIGGTVFADLNNNGLLDPGEPGLASSLLELRTASGQAIARAVSDANGQYRFNVDQTVDTNPATKTVEAVFDPAPTDVTRTQTVDQFDPSLGTLTAVEIIAEATLTSQMNVENLGPNAAKVDGAFSGTLTLQAPGTAPLVTNPTGNVSANVDPFDGTLDLAGPSGHDFAPTAMQTTKSVLLDAATTDLSAYVGTGKVTLTEGATATSTAAGPGNLLAMIRSATSADVKVVYHYNPSNALRPGSYTIIQTQEPPGYVDGLDTPDNVTPLPGSNATDSLPVTLGTGDSLNNNFGEVRPVSQPSVRAPEVLVPPPAVIGQPVGPNLFPSKFFLIGRDWMDWSWA
jgi:hypothetical protein